MYDHAVEWLHAHASAHCVISPQELTNVEGTLFLAPKSRERAKLGENKRKREEKGLVQTKARARGLC